VNHWLADQQVISILVECFTDQPGKAECQQAVTDLTVI